MKAHSILKHERILSWIKRHKAASGLMLLCAFALMWWLCCLPKNLFADTAYSSIVLSREGELLGARIASDQQWRFPPRSTVPQKYALSLIEFEDKHFMHHPGVNPLSLARAMKQNLQSGHIVSGGSTITMQVVRMSRGRQRTLWQKAVECAMATRLELRCTKEEILALYASHAPFGGNVVGLDAAAWRYFGRSPEDMSWSEAATLAVLSNAPSSIHLSKKRDELRLKRNRLLARLHDKGLLNDTDYELACDEPLPSEPQPLPSIASHYVEQCHKEHPGQITKTGIEISLQHTVEQITDRWCREYSAVGMADMAAVVIDVRSGEVRAYVGNADMTRARYGSKVDIARAPRSTGSTLKPFLYCGMLQDGEILPGTLIPDTPVNINGFTPQNFDLHYSGAVPASEALSRSLNVPAVHMLRQYGVDKFLDLLHKLGLDSFRRSADDYGLSLILGGGEGRLTELTRAYADMAAYYEYGVKEGDEDGNDANAFRYKTFPFYDCAALYHCFEALSNVNRPDEMDWRRIKSVRKVAWKTGTSYGFRDGWAIGVTPGYAVGVWVGNASGEGVPSLVGGKTAGPVMFDIFNTLPDCGWFRPLREGEYIQGHVCRESGMLMGLDCEHCDTLCLPLNAMQSKTCPYHKRVNVTDGGAFRVEVPCADSRSVSMFILPPAMEWYYRMSHPAYKSLPPLRTGSQVNGVHVPMQFIYPEAGSHISIPRRLDGSLSEVIFSLAHSNPATEVFWHLDQDYIGSTRHHHQMGLCPPKGRHTLTVVDSQGNTLSLSFTIDATF